MARKPTKAQLREALWRSGWSDDELQDPRVLRAKEALARSKEEEDDSPFGDIRSTFDTTEVPPPSAGFTSLDKFGTAVKGGLADIGADAMFGDIDADAAERIRKQEEDKRIEALKSKNLDFTRFISDPMVELANRDYVSPLVAKAAGAVGSIKSYREGFKGLSDLATEKRAEVEAETRDMISRNPIRGTIERAVLDVGGSPQSLASIPGGAFAAIPAATTYNDAYRSAREGGASPDDAKQYAAAQAGIEGGISAIPAGKVGRAIFGSLGRAGTAPIRSSLSEIARRTARTTVGESVEEMTQQVAGDLVDRYTANWGDDPVTREFAKTQVSQDLLGETLRAGLAGAAGGAGFGGVHESLRVAKENGQLAQAATKRFNQDQSARQRSADVDRFMADAAKADADKARSTAIDATKLSQGLKAASVGQSKLDGPSAEQAKEAAKIAKKNAAEAKRKAQEAELRTFAGAPEAAKQGLSAGRVLVNNLTTNRGSADAKRALSLLASGRLEILNNPAELGVQEAPGYKTRGLERDGKMYIFAENIDKSKDVAPQLAATLFHEIKHAADFGEGDAKLPDNLAGFIGMDNAEPINAKIEQAAARGNTVAVEALKRAEASGNVEEELIPHFISVSKENRNKASGLANVWQDLRGSVKSQYNSMFGNDEGVSIDDIYKLSEQLTDYVAQNESFNTQPKDTNVNIDGRRMIISKGTGAPAALQENRTYLSADGNRKYEISDNESRMTIPENFETDTPYRADEIIKHDKLWEEFPELREIPVFIDTKLGKQYGEESFGAGFSRPDKQYPNGAILLNAKWVNSESNKFNSDVHTYMIHELQHAAQNMGGTTGGSSPSAMMTPEDTRQLKTLRKKVTELTEAIEGAKALGAEPSLYEDLTEERKGYEESIKEINEDALRRYDDVLGEAEAYQTMARIPLTQQERGEDTYDINDTLENKIIRVRGQITSARGKRLDTPGRRESAPIAQSQKTPTDRKVGKVLGLFSAFGELGRELGVRAEEAVGEASYYADLAQTTSLRIKRGVKQAAQQLVADGKATSISDGINKINDRVRGTLDKLVKIEDEGLRQSAIAGLVREHPELQGIQDGYNLINDATRQIIRQMLASSPGPLTDVEIKKMKTLIKNQTRYLTRAYAAFQGKEGNTWARKLENEYQLAKEFVKKGKDIPAKYAESFRVYNNALEYVARENVAVFDPEELAEATLDKVRMVYDTWFSNRKGVEDEIKRTSQADESDQPAEVKQALIDAIVAKGEQVRARQVVNRAHTIVNGLLGLSDTNNPVVSYYRGFKQDKSILMDRTHIPKEISELFGEITDPSLRIMLTIAKQGELIARTNMLLDIRDNMYGRKIISNEDKEQDNNNTFSQQLKGENWGPLEDHWVTPEVYQTVRDDREIAVNMEDAIGRLVLDANAVNTKLGVKALSYYTRLAGLQKLAAIVWNPAQTIWNFGGSWISGIKEGNVDPRNYVRAGKSAAKLFAKELQAAGAGGRILENDPDVEDLIRYDVIDSAMVQEIRKLPTQYIRQIVNDHGHVRNTLAKGRDISLTAIKQMFALSDLTVKIANFYNQVNQLKAYYEAEGIEKPDDTIKKEAANIIKDTNITFRRAAPIVKMGERAGLTYVMPYIQGVFRSAIYGYVQGTKDVVRAVNEAQTPKGRALMLRQGLGRIAGSTVALYLVQALAQSVVTGDEEKDAKIRQLQTLDARYGDSVYVGDDDKGNPMLLRWSRFDPYGPLTDLIRISESDATPEQKNRDIAASVKELLIKPRLGQEILKSAVEFVTDEPTIKTKQTKMERLFPQMTEVTKDFLADLPGTDYSDAESLIGVLDTMLPGATNIVDPNNRAPVEWGKDEFDNATAKMLLATGGRLDTINPTQAAVFAGKELEIARKEARTRLFSKLQTVDATDKEAVMEITRLLDDERLAFIRVKEVYEGMQALGMSKSEINQVLKEKARISEHDRHLLYSGKYDTSLEGWRTNGSSVLSKKSINERLKIAEDKNPDPKSAEEQKKAVKDAVKVLRELGIKVKE